MLPSPSAACRSPAPPGRRDRRRGLHRPRRRLRRPVLVPRAALSFVLALLSLLLWPIPPLHPAGPGRRGRPTGSTERVVIVGLDGLDPTLAEQFMAEGKLPNFSRLASARDLRAAGRQLPIDLARGVVLVHDRRGLLATTTSSTSSAATRATTPPVLSSAEIRSPAHAQLGTLPHPHGQAPAEAAPQEPALLEAPRRARRLQLRSSACPSPSPRRSSTAAACSGMCAPDLRGSQGTFSYYTTKAGVAEAKEGGMRVPVTRDGRPDPHACLHGPSDELTRGGGNLTTPLVIRIDEARPARSSTSPASGWSWSPGSYSPWVPVTFKAAPGMKVHGICRFYLNQVAPDFDLYVTPDPDRPREAGDAHLASRRLLGLSLQAPRTATARSGWPRTPGRSTRASSTRTRSSSRPGSTSRSASASSSPPSTRRGAGSTVCVFDTPDRIQHMFFRTLDDAHPANAGKETARYKGVIEDVYKRMDDARSAEVHGAPRRQERPDRDVRPRLHAVPPRRQHQHLAAPARLPRPEGGQDRQRRVVRRRRLVAHPRVLPGAHRPLHQPQGPRGPGHRRRGRGAGRPQAASWSTKLTGLVDTERGELAIREVLDAARHVLAARISTTARTSCSATTHGYRTSWECATRQGHRVRLRRQHEAVERRPLHRSRSSFPASSSATAPIQRPAPGHPRFAPTVLSLFGVPVPPYMEGRC